MKMQDLEIKLNSGEIENFLSTDPGLENFLRSTAGRMKSNMESYSLRARSEYTRYRRARREEVDRLRRRKVRSDRKEIEDPPAPVFRVSKVVQHRKNLKGRRMIIKLTLTNPDISDFLYGTLRIRKEAQRLKRLIPKKPRSFKDFEQGARKHVKPRN